MSEKSEFSTRQPLSRRSVGKAVAWGVPAAVVAANAPAFAASIPCSQSVSWHAKSRIDLSTPDYSNENYDEYVNFNTTPPGVMKIQHWLQPNFKGTKETRVMWRIILAFPDGAKSGAQLTIPIAKTDNWTDPHIYGYLTLAQYEQFEGPRADEFTNVLSGYGVQMTKEHIVITFGEIPPRTAGGVIIDGAPIVPEGKTAKDVVYTATSDMNFVVGNCVNR